MVADKFLPDQDLVFNMREGSKIKYLKDRVTSGEDKT